MDGDWGSLYLALSLGRAVSTKTLVRHLSQTSTWPHLSTHITRNYSGETGAEMHHVTVAVNRGVVELVAASQTSPRLAENFRE